MEQKLGKSHGLDLAFFETTLKNPHELEIIPLTRCLCVLINPNQEGGVKVLRSLSLAALFSDASRLV